MSENTVSNIFARQGILENKRHGLFFVGYADPETPGGRIRLAQPGESVLLDPAHPPVPLNCEMRIFDFSGHSTRDAIADYIVKVAAEENLPRAWRRWGRRVVPRGNPAPPAATPRSSCRSPARSTRSSGRVGGIIPIPPALPSIRKAPAWPLKFRDCGAGRDIARSVTPPPLPGPAP